ncbi:NAD-dependent epimerase/dehydratase family protein [Paradesertivirga mongoliensis]|uniref:NAD-dependent epimerase/dehydratase family protein n=1 Tax=Paradesertivirga mongoliensis TaxID=2100740 RepID=A0ABW4ZIM2_9SPHI|nr:NAD(P)-dependent oxidoreductase [Pedobacter mongoliensis]
MRLLITGGSGFIGSNFIDLLTHNNFVEFINVDKQRPLNSQHNDYWRPCDILEKEKLRQIFDQYAPTHVLHLAARTDTASDKLEDYVENTEGTANLINAVENQPSVKLTIIASTQYVYKSKEFPLPEREDQYIPHTAYGVSKKLSEEATRNSSMHSAWTIIRPTNVWGPWNMRYPNEFLKIIDKGLYFHPGKANPIKSYAYVKNVAHQIWGILQSPTQAVDKQVYYVGDPPMASLTWVNSFSQELTGKKVKSFPVPLMRLASHIGDYIKKLNIPFPLHMVRFNNMLDDYDTPMQKTLDAFGLSHPNLEENVQETIGWIRGNGKFFFPYWRDKR